MTSKHFYARNLAAAFLAGPLVLKELVERGARACGQRPRWLRQLARRALAFLNSQSRAAGEHVLACFIEADRGFDRVWQLDGYSLAVHQIFVVPPVMAPSPWPVPSLPTPAALAEWLSLDLRELDWFADCLGREATTPAGPLRHYTYCWLAGRHGKARLLEMPKQRLKAIQRRLLHELLAHLPVDEAAHGYRKGRSVATYAAAHAGQRIVLRFDLCDFFPSIRAARVHALFRAAGCPLAVARLLTGLCTNAVPGEVLQAIPGGDASALHRLRSSHLPQGAPTSPALANLCAYRLDRRLTGLARAVGARYTRYADDLAFSGNEELERCARRFQVHVCRIALEEGFEVNTRKSRFMRQGVRQQLAGVVVNAHPNLRRAEYERLKAMLFNCVRHGPESQNHAGHEDFRGYLLGRIAYVEMLNPGRGRRLRASFERIRW
jgi:hypothetical protein